MHFRIDNLLSQSLSYLTTEFNALVTLRWLASQPGGVEIFLVDSYYRNLDRHQPDESLGSYADFTYLAKVPYVDMLPQVDKFGSIKNLNKFVSITLKSNTFFWVPFAGK